MDRKKFIKICGYSIVGIPAVASILQSCKAIYYANIKYEPNRWVVQLSEFLIAGKQEVKHRDFVLIKPENLDFPICIYRIDGDQYYASLLKCTHRGCELNVGGRIYSCPCHGSEFSIEGKVLEGPANQDLKHFKTEVDQDNIYVYA